MPSWWSWRNSLAWRRASSLPSWRSPNSARAFNMPTCAFGLVAGASGFGSAPAFTACTTASASATRRSNRSRAARRVLPGGHNFGVLLPWWDMLMGSANFELRYDPTGVRDQIEPGPDGQLRDYGQGFCAQQWRGVLRLLGRA